MPSGHCDVTGGLNEISQAMVIPAVGANSRCHAAIVARPDLSGKRVTMSTVQVLRPRAPESRMLCETALQDEGADCHGADDGHT
ncbi:MAG: hypothetical protein VB858_14240 [Planctomycetaceae bacterium]